MTAHAAPLGIPAARKNRQIALGAAAIGFAIVFNLPFSVLGATFDYPQVLRRPPGEVLDLFAAAGPGLVLTWYAFLLCAMALIPLSGALAIARQRLAARPRPRPHRRCSRRPRGLGAGHRSSTLGLHRAGPRPPPR